MFGSCFYVSTIYPMHCWFLDVLFMYSISLWTFLCSLFSFYGLYCHLLWLIMLFGLPTTRLAPKVRGYRGAGGFRLRLSKQVAFEVFFEGWYRYDKRECQKVVSSNKLLQPQLRRRIKRGRFLFLVQPAAGRRMTVYRCRTGNSRLDQVAQVCWRRGRPHLECQRRHLVADPLPDRQPVKRPEERTDIWSPGWNRVKCCKNVRRIVFERPVTGERPSRSFKVTAVATIW